MAENENVEIVEDLPHPPPDGPPGGGGARAGAAGVGAGVAGPEGGQGQAAPDMIVLIQAIAGAFKAAVAGAHGAAPQNGANVRLSLKRLRSLGGTEFRGLTPEGSESWLESTKRILGQLTCNNVQKLECIVSLLHGDAYTWWTTTISGSMYVAEYEIQFVRLSQYAPKLIPSEREICERFRYGLVADLKTYMLAADYTDFDVLVTRAKDIELNLGLAS
ncbi:hypothetical protein HRI_001501400 [Hibiscus trionum]|uniref:Retrotransposon gag domain-containing protein n=1 Tax=Hibiscus trionum TaxID=183268 RepID=A0A9W7LWA3_HIBTR|nr:hypothetical protein HRI_001501400 [Hibiscus trionum]